MNTQEKQFRGSDIFWFPISKIQKAHPHVQRSVHVPRRRPKPKQPRARPRQINCQLLFTKALPPPTQKNLFEKRRAQQALLAPPFPFQSLCHHRRRPRRRKNADHGFFPFVSRSRVIYPRIQSTCHHCTVGHCFDHCCAQQGENKNNHVGHDQDSNNNPHVRQRGCLLSVRRGQGQDDREQRH